MVMRVAPSRGLDKSKLPIVVHIGCARAPTNRAHDAAERFHHFCRGMVRTTVRSLSAMDPLFFTSQLPVSIHRLDRVRGPRDPDDLLRRVRRSDLVILDTSGRDAEITRRIRAIMSDRGKSSSLFLLHQSAAPPEFSAAGVLPDRPDDCSITRYEHFTSRHRPALRLLEPHGFTTALSASLLQAAEERNHRP